jgi:hypothetical protein
MVKQKHTPETSSADSGSRSKAREAFESLSEREKGSATDFGFRSLMQSLLVELANLHDDGHERLWASRKRLWADLFKRESRDELIELRDEVRQLWDSKTDISDKNQILVKWLQPKDDKVAIIARFEIGAIQPNPFNLRAMLAVAVLERVTRLAHCHNPSCPVPYFISKRKNQKYCERGDCTAFAQRQYALDWWQREHSSEKKKGRTKS